jgi:hypothetical protein
MPLGRLPRLSVAGARRSTRARAGVRVDAWRPPRPPARSSGAAHSLLCPC